VKKLISIGVVVALLALVVLPVAVAADDYVPPTTFAKIPFAIVQSGFYLIGNLLPALIAADIGIPDWLSADMMQSIGDWAGGPLAWSVDMLGWGVSLLATVLDSLAVPLGLPDWVAPMLGTVACQIFAQYSNVTGPAFDPCP
jgi:hypothetical protein